MKTIIISALIFCLVFITCFLPKKTQAAETCTVKFTYNENKEIVTATITPSDTSGSNSIYYFMKASLGGQTSNIITSISSYWSEGANPFNINVSLNDIPYDTTYGGTYYFNVDDLSFNETCEIIGKNSFIITVADNGQVTVTVDLPEAAETPSLKILTKPEPCYTSGDKAGIKTAIGCIPTDIQDFITVFLNWAIGLAGGIAFLFMLFGAFQILLSSGNPEKIKAGQEQLTSAIIGLLFIIFSVFILKIIGTPIMMISG